MGTGVDALPRLRAVDAQPVEVDGRRLIYLRDPEGIAAQGLGVPPHVFHLMTQLDGSRTCGELQAFFARHYNGTSITEGQIRELIRALDEAYFLESDRFRTRREEVARAYREAQVRPAAHAGLSYPDDPARLREMIDGFFEPPAGPGRPDGTTGGAVRGLVSPHVDFGRGGPCFAWAYGELAGVEAPDVFLIFGTGHAARRPYSTSGKTYETPLGPVEADGPVLERLLAAAGQDLLADELAQKNEHSIEFQAVFLRYLFPDRPFTIVPVLCGSFHDLVCADASPETSFEVEDFVAALRQALSGEQRRVCFVAGVDLSHVGPRFGDPEPVDDAAADRVAQSDRELIRAAEGGDAQAFFERVRRQGDRTRVCGTSSIYTMLRTMEAGRGRLLKYDRAMDPEGQSLVSFASMVFR